MKKITKVLVLVLLIAFTFALVGCGNGNNSTSSKTDYQVIDRSVSNIETKD